MSEAKGKSFAVAAGAGGRVSAPRSAPEDAAASTPGVANAELQSPMLLVDSRDVVDLADLLEAKGNLIVVRKGVFWEVEWCMPGAVCVLESEQERVYRRAHALHSELCAKPRPAPLCAAPRSSGVANALDPVYCDSGRTAGRFGLQCFLWGAAAGLAAGLFWRECFQFATRVF